MSRTSTREEALFAEALAQPPAQRGSFLAQACGADAALLARMAALIAAHEGTETLLRASAPPREIPSEEKPGDIIGLPAVLELFIKVCQAIQHAHQKGVIHRDIKPSNILVTVNDSAPTPKVIDFRFAKAMQGRRPTACSRMRRTKSRRLRKCGVRSPALPADAPFAEWSKWFFADRATRSIAPGFTIIPAEAEELVAGMEGKKS